MYKHEEPTPCPLPWIATHVANTSSVLSDLTSDTGRRNPRGSQIAQFGEGDTESLDFTTEFRANLRHAAPRRRRTATRRTGTWNPRADIHDDSHTLPDQERPALNHDPATSSLSPAEEKGNAIKRSAILAKPAARKPALAEVARPTRRRVSAMLADMDSSVAKQGQASEATAKADEQKLRKEPRRRTIYIPSEDTTIMTIHPGASLKTVDGPKPPRERGDSNEVLGALLEQDENAVQRHVTSERATKKAPRKSLAVAPKKAPLQPTSKPFQEQAVVSDIPGRGRGKENVPPGKSMRQAKRRSSVAISLDVLNGRKPGWEARKTDDKSSGDSSHGKVEKRRLPPCPSRKRPNSGPTEKEGHLKISKRTTHAAESPDNHMAQLPKVSKTTITDASLPLKAPKAQGKAPGTEMPPRLPSKLSIPLVRSAELSQEIYPILSDDISRPEMYEDSWLCHQEAAITQLVNGLFQSADQESAQSDHHDLRKSLLGLYQDTSFSLIHRRLQASLLYGALKIPKELLARSVRLQEDVGLKRRFLDLWLETYDLSSLRAAVEVIVGREMRQSSLISGMSDPDRAQNTPRSAKKAIGSFLDTFLVRNEDAVYVTKGIGSIGDIARGALGGSSMPDRRATETDRREWAWVRTVLRSLMLMLLLDKGKREGKIRGCLFVKSSVHKSSASTLQSLSNLLLPSLGDISRPLGHLNYDVAYTQSPLEEHNYRIHNLATDMRDGILLTKIVELLLYPPSCLPRQGDLTIKMPAGDILTMTCDSSNRYVLSHHLKYPCIARIQKMSNVQMALAALEGVTRGTANLGGVKAEDIVDGHREKTVGLLWGLVSRWGLEMIVDWKALEKEVGRLRMRFRQERSKQSFGTEEDVDEDEDSEDESELDYLGGLERYTWLLKAWASTIAKSHGRTVSNLTTSFADGQVFEMIVDEYEMYLHKPDLSDASKGGLESRLKNVGCSSFFAGLFGKDARHGRILDKDFVIASLAFLCSRLLQASVTGRAATTIQRAYRQTMMRRRTYQRLVLLRLAHDCKTVVVTRDRVINAGIVLQRAWRLCLQRRIDHLGRDVTSFQARARGAIIRRRAVS